MKMNSLKAAAVLGLSALLADTAAAQANSSPVGYETIGIDQTFNYVGLRLVGAAAASGSVSAIDVNSSSVTLSTAPAADGRYVLEVTSGSASGAVELVDVTGSAAVVSAGLAGDLADDDSYVLREPQTLASVFGDPINGLDGASADGGADLILIPDGSGGFDSYWYFDGGFGGAAAAEWRSLDSATGVSTAVDASAVNLVYTDGIIVQNRGDNNELVVTGSVKTTSSSAALTNQFNYLSNVYPAGSTLSTLFDDLPDNPGVLRGDTINGASADGGADLVLIPDNSGAFNTYWYFDGGFGGPSAAEWRQLDAASGVSTAVDSTTVLLDGASSIIIQNRGDIQGISLTAPGFYSTL